MSAAVDKLLSLLHLVTVRERDDLAATLRLVTDGYAPCSQCGQPVAELWHWTGGYGRPWGDEEDVLTEYCTACAMRAGLYEECVRAEPKEHIDALAKVRHLVWQRSTHATDKKGTQSQ